ncbi:MAG: rod shape-determining protein MreD [Clostridia bacterium]|nr:rod shape-determining protein MreD [Clostridia bacterium]
MTKSRHWGLKIVTFLIFFLSLTLFGGSGISLAILGVSPLLVLSVLTAFASYSRISVTVFASLLCGIVTDSVSAKGYCFNTIAFLIFGVLANLLAEHVFNRNLRATVTLCFLLTFAYYLAYWLCYSAFTLRFDDSMRYLLQWCLPSAIYTAVLCIPFYFLFIKFKQIRELD